ncbi:MAG TPA: hypothetical protein VN228_06025 [Pyrinomonadaceae bacterium]|nr:hypothetical protein [Pyrinomonadaceae bacterium]
MAKDEDCYVDIWRDANFGGECLRLHGPAEFPRLLFEQGDWGDQIGSLRVGPRAFVLAYRDRDFKDKKVTFGPNDEVADLSGLKFDDDIDSVQVIDSLKIFDRLLGRQDPPAAAEAPPKRRRVKKKTEPRP